MYEYECTNCHLRFEAHKNLGYYNQDCPKCGHQAEKRMSTFNFSFGWRLTDASHERFGPRDEFEKDV